MDVFNDAQPYGSHVQTLSIVVEVRTKSWVVGISAPDIPNTVRVDTLSTGDTAGLVAKIVKARCKEMDRVLLIS